MAEKSCSQKKLSREQKKIQSVMKLFDKAQKLEMKKQAKDKIIHYENTILAPNPKKKIKVYSLVTQLNSSSPSDTISTTNLNDCSSNSFEVVPHCEKIEVVNSSIFNSAYGINEQEILFHLLDYRNIQKQKSTIKINTSTSTVFDLEQDSTQVVECQNKLLQKTKTVFDRVSNLFNISRPSVISMHHFKPKAIVKG